MGTDTGPLVLQRSTSGKRPGGVVMGRWRSIAAVGAFIVASACAPKPIGPSYNLVVSHQSAGGSPLGPGIWTSLQGTITNTGVAPADYIVRLVGSSGETGSSAVHDVLVGQTAIWWTTIEGDVTVSQVAVTSTAKVAGRVPATAV